MKNKIIGLLILGVMSQTFAQEEILFIAKLKKNEVPKIITKAVKKDFPKLEVVEFLSIPYKNGVMGDVNKNIFLVDGYDSYLVTFKGKTMKTAATYSEKGNLISTVDHYKYKSIPYAIKNKVALAYPDWVILTGYKKMSSYDEMGNISKFHFKISLENGDKKRKIYTNESGEILNRKRRVKIQA